MQMTLSLTPSTHLFVKNGMVFIKLNKPSKFSDHRGYDVVNPITLEQAKMAHDWLGKVIADYNEPPTPINKTANEYLAEIKKLLTPQPTQETTNG